MRKIFAMLVVLGALAASASADILEFRPYAGYTTVNMASINGDLEAIRSTLLTEGAIFSVPYQESQAQPLGNGFVAGGDFSTTRLLPWKSIRLDLRGEYLQTNQAEYKAYLGGEYDETVQGSLSSALLGAFWEPGNENGSVDLSVGAFVGLGYGVISRMIDEGDGPLGDSYSRVGAVGQLEGRVNWHVAKSLTLSGNCGYRVAALGQVFDAKNHPMLSTLSETLGVNGADTLDADFSGFTATGALSYAF